MSAYRVRNGVTRYYVVLTFQNALWGLRYQSPSHDVH